jgi:hypothetical protein
MHCVELCRNEKGALWRLVIVTDLLAIVIEINERLYVEIDKKAQLRTRMDLQVKIWRQDATTYSFCSKPIPS